MKTSVYPIWLVVAVILFPTVIVGAEPEQTVRPYATVQRDVKSGIPRLIARSQGAPVKFQVNELWRYDPESNRWSREEFKTINKVLGSGVVGKLTDSVGLYWVKWKENGVPYGSLVFSGPVLCNDIDLGPSPKADMVPTCIPLKNSARAAYVPDPKVYCER